MQNMTHPSQGYLVYLDLTIKEPRVEYILDSEPHTSTPVFVSTYSGLGGRKTLARMTGTIMTITLKMEKVRSG